MKKIPIILPLVLTCLTPCRAQIRIGIVGGAAVTGISLPNENSSIQDQSSPSQNTENLTGKFSDRITGYGGLALNYFITSNFSLNAKLLYSVRGWKEKGSLDSTSYDIASQEYVNYDSSSFSEIYTIQYFDLPLQFTFYAPVGKTQLYWGVGPYLSYAIGGYYKSQAYGDDSIGFVNFNHPQKSNSFHGNQLDWGFDLSAGLLLRSGLSFDLSYMAGIRDVLTDRFYFLANRNRTFHFGLTYYFKNTK